MAWTPGQRPAALKLEEAYIDVPSHLKPLLADWVGRFLNSGEICYGIAMHLRLPTADPRRGSQARDLAAMRIRDRVRNDSESLLDTIEWLLATYGDELGENVVELEDMLIDGNSAYTVADDAGGLEMRTIPEVREAVQQVANDAAGSAGTHLASAWNETYGRTSDPSKAYSEAIKAVEAAAAPVISPKHKKATLGTMIGDLRSVPEKWKLAIEHPSGNDSVQDIIAMMSLLWDGQTSRHGGVAPTVPETEGSAKTAVALAAALVQIFHEGSFSAK